MGILDSTHRGRHVGCPDLLTRIDSISHLQAHVFGHVHEQGGKSVVIKNTTFINAAWNPKTSATFVAFDVSK